MTKRTEGMSNLEWLEFVKKSDNTFFEKYSSKISDMPDNIKVQWRQVKALEIIAEELIHLGEIANILMLHFNVAELRKEDIIIKEDSLDKKTQK